MKPAVLAQRLEPLLPHLRCPRCSSSFVIRDEQSLVCAASHCYDLSRRGYVNLAPQRDQSGEKYDASLFESRRLVFENGFYAPVMDAIAALLSNRFAAAPFRLLDAGCGEGYYTRALIGRFPSAQMIGVDLSRDAITAAARIQGTPAWLVADLKHLPFADGIMDVVLDVLTPADYNEFQRILAPEGVLIKVIPGVNYLAEVRKAVAPMLRGGGDYDNARVLNHLKEHADLLSEQEICFTRPLTPELSAAFLRMTPMTFSIPEYTLQALHLDQITIHMHVLCCRMAR